MGTDLSQKFYEILQKHLESGVPLKDMRMTDDQRHRATICLDVYNRLQENDMMDVKAYLRRRYQRTVTEIRQDVKVINYLISELDNDTRELSRYRIRKAAEKVMRMGEAQGDWKPIVEGAKMLHKAEGLDQPESAIDIEQTVNPLPYVLVSAPKGKQEYDEKMLDKLRKKYHAEKDKTQEMVEAKLGMFVPAGSMMTDEDFSEVETVDDGGETMFDEFDPDDDGN